MKHRNYRAFFALNPLDQLLRKAKPEDMNNGIKLTIELFNGFENFGHHETWALGYRITDGKITVEKEFLDDAIEEFCEKIKKK